MRLRTLALAVPVALALAVHLPSVRNGFMGDDFFLVLGNPQITEPGHLRAALTSDWFDTGRASFIGYWRPTLKLCQRALYAWFGPWPPPFHLWMVLTHALAVGALASVLLQLGGPLIALLGAGLFAVHPTTVEAVCMISGPGDVMAGAFVLLAAALHLRWRRTRRPALLCGVLLSAAVAVTSKESAVLLPVVLFGVSLADGAGARAALVESAGGFGVAVAAIALRLSFLARMPLPNALGLLSPARKLLASLAALGGYPGALWAGTTIVRLPQLPAGLDAHVVLGLLLLSGAAAVWLVKRGKGVEPFAVVLGAAGFAPVLAVWLLHIPSGALEIPIAERWAYLPAAAASVLTASLLARLQPRLAFGLAGVIALFYAVLAVDRGHAYFDDRAFERHTLEEYRAVPESELSEAARLRKVYYEAQEAREAGKPDEARALYEKGKQLAPYVPGARLKLAQLALDADQPQEAERQLLPIFAPDYRSAAAVQQRAAHNDDVLTRYPSRPHELLGRAYALQKRFPEAARELGRAAQLETDPGHRAILKFLQGAALENAGDKAGAAKAYTESAALDPGFPAPQDRLRALR